MKDIINKINNPNGWEAPNGIWNSIEWIDDKAYRNRVEVLIFKGNKVFLYFKNNENQYGNNYVICGGSPERRKTLEQQVYEESKEEARILIKNIKDTGIVYMNDFNKQYPKWHVEKLHPYGLIYEGSITHVYIAEYDKPYNGYIDIHDKDDKMYQNGKFYDINFVIDKLSEHHKQAVEIYMNKINESYADDGNIIDMSYSKDDVDDAEDWSEDSDIIIITPKDSLDDLEDEWNQWQSMTKKQRDDSDNKSLEIFGINNYDHYIGLKSKLLGNTNYDNNEGNSDQYISTEGTTFFQDDYSPINLSYTKDDIDDIKDWSNKADLIIITPKDTLEELEDEWNQWQCMVKHQKKESDHKSLEIFGITNYDHYIGLRNKLLKNTNTNTIDSSDSFISTESTISFINANMINDKEILTIKSSIQYELTKENINKLNIGSELLKLQSLKEDHITNTIIKESINTINNKKNITTINCYPFFTPEEINSFGTYKNNNLNYYNESADNVYIDKDNAITTKQWFEEYVLIYNGIITENTSLYTNLWIQRLNELYLDYNSIKESGDMSKINKRKQSILELGWNPEIDFSIENRIKCNNKMKSIIESKYNNIDIVDLTHIEVTNENTILNETDIKEDNILYPVYIVLSYNYSLVQKVVSVVTNSIYSHAAIGLDTKLDRLYSFNMKNGNWSGFSLESIKQYLNQNNKSKMAVYVIFVKKPDLLKIKTKLDDYIVNIKNTKYNFLDAAAIALNKSVAVSNSVMICSQFVDSILKYVGINITDKNSESVIPKDFLTVKNKKIYKVYEGLIKDYNISNIDTLINKLRLKAKYIKEGYSILNESEYINLLYENSNNIDTLINLNEYYTTLSDKNMIIYENFIKPYIDIQPICETKEFPVQFDQDGNLLIQSQKSIDFESEYAKSHKLLLAYDNEKNIEGIKYELSKLWFMNNLLEEKIYKGKSNKIDLQSYHKARAKILNDFKKYMKEVHKLDKEFNFTVYYNNTPFSDSTIKVNSSTLKHSGQALKSILKLLL